MLAKKIIDNKEISLESHSIDVYKKVENILETENFLLDKEDKNAVILASLLHDIGKCTKGFQDFLKGKKEKPNQKYWHNEISWAVLSMYFPEISEQTLFYVYWHHGVTNNNSKNQKYNIDILETLESEDLESIIEFTKNIYKKVYKKDIYFEEQIDIKPLPTFLTKN